MKATLKENGKVIVEFDLGQIEEEFLSFLSALEISKKSKAEDKEIFDLAEQIKRNWWIKNKKKFIADENCT
jgi:hypothetical protein